ncbi:MAG: hypothetical protein JXM69_16960 [Anaerolineae bacterium]|nr:hypothetical protein [Anaerolineae bacterium]
MAADQLIEEDFDDEYEDTPGTNRRKRIRVVLLGIFVLLLICLIIGLVYQIFYGGNGETKDTPTPTLTPTSEGVDIIVTPEIPTPTATQVVVEEPTSPATEEPIPPPQLTEEPAMTPTTPPSGGVGPIISPGAVENLLKNGDFEEGFDTPGVALEWTGFHNDSVIVLFSSESMEPYVKSGASAQRITLADAVQGDRYAGIYQQVNLVPGEIYTLTLYGQIRTGFADVNLSSYGYRMQYAIDHGGSDKWQDIPAENWVELPWDEQSLHSVDVEFVKYTTTLTSSGKQITLFIRAWNKWADPGEVQYTLDSLSLVGPSPVGGGPEQDETLIDQPLPTTGAGDASGFIGSGVFWGALIVLLLLAAGAIYRGKWSYYTQQH